MKTTLLLASSVCLASTGCLEDISGEPRPDLNVFEAVEVSVVADRDDGLRGPRDLDFNPEVEGELWVINRIDDAAITIRGLGTSDQEILRRKDPFALHFMEETSSISFSSDMKFGTCGESRNTYDNTAPANDFMGPALWSADDDIFAISNPEAIADNGGADLGSHLDMMHETPLCMGIAWVSDNIYFVYEGLTGTIARYDFRSDHGPGFDFHGDGTVERFVDVAVGYAEDVPSHLVYDHNTDLLYVADTAGGRVLRIDADTAIQMREFRGFETMVQESEGATVESFLVGGDADMQLPSGLALAGDTLFVSDNLTSTIHAFDLEGTLLDSYELDVAEGGLMGLRVSPAGDEIYAVDFEGDRVLRLSGVTLPE
jgi:hypothetical protein